VLSSSTAILTGSDFDYYYKYGKSICNNSKHTAALAAAEIPPARISYDRIGDREKDDYYY
jgi:hypothetical protein